jgi:hypothetical protein
LVEISQSESSFVDLEKNLPFFGMSPFFRVLHCLVVVVASIVVKTNGTIRIDLQRRIRGHVFHCSFREMLCALPSESRLCVLVSVFEEKEINKKKIKQRRTKAHVLSKGFRRRRVLLRQEETEKKMPFVQEKHKLSEYSFFFFSSREMITRK